MTPDRILVMAFFITCVVIWLILSWYDAWLVDDHGEHILRGKRWDG